MDALVEETDGSWTVEQALPSAVLSSIFSRLDVRSLCSTAATCRSFRSLAGQALSFLPSFHLLDVSLTSDLLTPLMPPNPHLTSLVLDCTRLDDSSIHYLARPSLHHLCLHNCNNLSGRLLSQIGVNCCHLKSLSLCSVAERRGLPTAISDLEALIRGCSQLESLILALDLSTFDNPKFGEIWSAASERLSSLDIGYIPLTMLIELLSLTVKSRQPSGHVRAPFFPSLKTLCLSVDYITDYLMASISKGLPLLTYLDLQDAPFIEPVLTSDLTNVGLQRISAHGKLKHISLVRSQEFLITYFRRVDDQGFLLMSEKCSKWESICLGGFYHVTDTGFRAIIHACSNLSKLVISGGNRLTDLMFHDISATSLSLIHVSLTWCNLLSNRGIMDLARNKQLTILDLRDCRNVGDQAMKALSYLSKLQVLLLDGTNTSDLGLSYLSQTKSPLVSLSLRGCKRLTDNCMSSLFSGSVGSGLKVLDLSRLPNLSDNGILSLAKSRVPIVELRLRECPNIGDTTVMALASMLVDGGTHGSSLYLLDMYACGGITPLAIRWFKKPYFPRLRWLGVTGILNRDMVDSLSRTRPFLNVACRGEELGTRFWGNNPNKWYRQNEEELDELEQWLLDGDYDDDEIIADMIP